MWLSWPLVHARRRAGRDRRRADRLRFTTVICSIPAVSHRCGSAAIRAALILPAARALTKDLQVYSFLQLPLYQFVNGVQLVADRALVVGLSTRF